MAIQLIEVNLSEELARRSHRKAARVHVPMSVGVILAVSLVLLAVFHLVVYFREQGYDRRQAELRELTQPSKEAEKLQAYLDQLQSQSDVLAAWDKARIDWARCWRALSVLLPDSAVLTSILIEHGDAVGEKPRLVLNGRVKGASGESIVLGFIDRLELEPVFTSTFNDVVLSSIHSEEDEKVFTVELTR